ncbi:hypothetical protein, partial [Vibrio vulnificus]|uniref:hypothetical protein n=1 Tax=Vibrio vulnificus TaxID=672 RepID=UPI0019D43FD6
IELESDIVVPSGESIKSHRVFPDVSIRVSNVDLSVDLIEFPIDEFEVILGMDWLDKYKAKIDCHQKKVSLRGPKGVKVSFKGVVVRSRV